MKSFQGMTFNLFLSEVLLPQSLLLGLCSHEFLVADWLQCAAVQCTKLMTKYCVLVKPYRCKIRNCHNKYTKTQVNCFFVFLYKAKTEYKWGEFTTLWSFYDWVLNNNKSATSDKRSSHLNRYATWNHQKPT